MKRLAVIWLGGIGLATFTFLASAYTAQPIEELTGDHYYSSSFFPESSTQSVFWPDADLNSLTRAMLIVEANEAQLPHVRYRINYSVFQDTEAPEITRDYIEITRYNLGPSLRTDLLEYLEAEYVASEAEFGVGPHVSWRFVMAPVMGLQADIIEAERQEISDAIAQNTMCFSQPCLALEDAQIPLKETRPIHLSAPLSSSYITHTQKSPGATTRPARVIEEMWAAFGSDGMDPLPYDKDQPQFTFVISNDVVGQESNIFGLALQHIVLDHTVAKVWLQRQEVAGGEVELIEAIQSR